MVIMRMTPCLQPCNLRLAESQPGLCRGWGGAGWGQCQHQLLQADLAVSRGEAWDFPSQAALPEHGGSEGLEQGACRQRTPGRLGLRQTSGQPAEVRAHHAFFLLQKTVKNTCYLQAIGQGSNLSVWPYHIVALGFNCLAQILAH